MGSAIDYIISTILSLLFWAVVIDAILSWLVAFNVVNLHHPAARQITRVLDAIVQPMVRPIRRIVPLLGGVDLSYLVLLVILKAIQIAFLVSVAPRLAILLN